MEKIHQYAELKTFGKKADGYFQFHRKQHSSIPQIPMEDYYVPHSVLGARYLAVGKADTNLYSCRGHILGEGDRQRKNDKIQSMSNDDNWGKLKQRRGGQLR